MKFDYDNPINLNENNLKMAFQFTGIDPKTEEAMIEKNDPNFVKMVIWQIGQDPDGEYFEKVIPHHTCTEEEYAEFNPFSSISNQSLEKFRALGEFNCIDWDDKDPYLVFGRPE